MSARRSTRASSRAASAAPEAAATPRRSRRVPGTSPLPALSARQSTAYGSAMAVAPVPIIQSGYGTNLTNVLAGIVRSVESEDDEREDSGTDVSRTFGAESGLFGDAGLETPKTPARAGQQRRARPRQPTIPEEDAEELDPLPVVLAPVVGQIGLPVAWYAAMFGGVLRFVGWVLAGARSVVDAFNQRYPAMSSMLKQLSLLAIILVFSCASYELFLFGGEKTGLLPDSIEVGGLQHVYHWNFHLFTQPTNSHLWTEALEIRKQMAEMEKSITLNADFILGMWRQVPDYVVFKKDSDGQSHIPMDFWLALQEKIESEYPTLNLASDDFRKTIGPAQIQGTAWVDFLRQNEDKLQALVKQTFEGPHARDLRETFRNGFEMVSREEVKKLITQKYEDMQLSSSKEVRDYLDGEMARFGKELKDSLRRIDSDHDHDARRVARETVIDMLSSKSQLQAVAGFDVQEQINHALLQVNHLSIGNGAVVNPYLTSPTFQFSNQRANALKRTLLWLSGNALPSPNRPFTALVKWDEAGECWCSPSHEPDTDIQLGVLLGHDIYPDEIIIEHIPAPATLDPGSMPKDLQLFAKIQGAQDLHKAGTYSEGLFPKAVEKTLDETWVLLGEWQFKYFGKGHIQKFTPQVKLRDLEISTRELVIRAKNNWGEADHTCLYRVRAHGDVVRHA